MRQLDDRGVNNWPRSGMTECFSLQADKNSAAPPTGSSDPPLFAESAKPRRSVQPSVHFQLSARECPSIVVQYPRSQSH